MELIENFKKERPFYERFTNKLDILLQELIKDKKIDFHLIESRTKTIDSFQEKIHRKKGNYNDINDITDLSAIRIIVYYPTDISRIESIIKSEFEIDDKNSKSSGSELNVNEFGYLSSHLVFKLSKNRKDLPEWNYNKDFKCEVQIRTVLQHAWASISHTLQYKTKSDIPSSLQRKLFRLASLFELADEQFVSIKDLHESLKIQIATDHLESQQEVNMLTLTNFLGNSKIVAEIYSLALQSGFTDESEEPGIPNNDSDTISNLTSFCDILNINTIGNLEKVLSSIKKDELKLLFKNQFNHERILRSEWFVSPSFILILILIYYSTDKITINKLSDNGWDLGIAKRVIRTSLKTKESIGKK